uniref:SET domain-containing protein n=1 Tax=Alexandrium monilatum TaxID=311494 RepID=A0A7S4RQZ3_9DINO|mmetsp:Transcript_104265/g.331540  ORF Transcript_104265/g.331540 Transcript_104265/m.331540 type:complete len:506 (+) Transcript_104265:71-1588(+)
MSSRSQALRALPPTAALACGAVASLAVPGGRSEPALRAPRGSAAGVAFVGKVLPAPALQAHAAARETFSWRQPRDSVRAAQRSGVAEGGCRPCVLGLALLAAPLVAGRLRRAAAPRRAAVQRRAGAAPATVLPTEAKEDEALWEKFSSWLSARGGNCSAVAMGRPNGLRGVIALRDIEEGESIIEVPLEAVVRLCDPSEEKDPSVSALEMLRLYRAGGELQPYLDLVPSPGSQDFAGVPDFMSDEELEMLQCPPAAEKTRRRKELCATRAAEHGVPPEDLQWALCTVTMRSFTVLSPMENVLRVLLPGIDLLNHDADTSHKFKVLWTLNPEYDGLFKVVAGGSIKKGEEIRICYGGNPYRTEGCGGDCVGDMAWTNEQYLQRYGFIDTSVGTTIVDGRWLVSEAAAPVCEALERTGAEEDDALLAGDALSPGARAAVGFRRHLKRALVAQREVQAARAAAGQEPEEEKASEPHFSPEMVEQISRMAEAANKARATEAKGGPKAMS